MGTRPSSHHIHEYVCYCLFSWMTRSPTHAPIPGGLLHVISRPISRNSNLSWDTPGEPPPQPTQNSLARSLTRCIVCISCISRMWLLLVVYIKLLTSKTPLYAPLPTYGLRSLESNNEMLYIPWWWWLVMSTHDTKWKPGYGFQKCARFFFFFFSELWREKKRIYMYLARTFCLPTCLPA